jgi:hypothetical protein
MRRLNRVTKELKVGLATAMEFLKANYGVNVCSLNDKITDEQYNALVEYVKDGHELNNDDPKNYLERGFFSPVEIKLNKSKYKKGVSVSKRTIYSDIDKRTRFISIPTGGMNKRYK